MAALIPNLAASFDRPEAAQQGVETTAIGDRGDRLLELPDWVSNLLGKIKNKVKLGNWCQGVC